MATTPKTEEHKPKLVVRNTTLNDIKSIQSLHQKVYPDETVCAITHYGGGGYL